MICEYKLANDFNSPGPKNIITKTLKFATKAYLGAKKKIYRFKIYLFFCTVERF